MFWTLQKLEKRAQELSEWRYRDVRPLENFRLTEDPEGEVGEHPPSAEGAAPARIGDAWSGRDRYVWLHMEAEFPSSWKGRDIVGRFDFGRTGGGNNSGFESLLFVNDAPYQGVDSNHTEVFFPEDSAGRTLKLDFRLWSGLEGGGPRQIQHYRFQRAEIGWLDAPTDDLYYTARAVVETVKVLAEHDPVRIELLKILDRSFLQLDWSEPGSDRFYASIRSALDDLKTALDKMEKSHPVTVRCIGHTHIDVAWLWRLKHTREKSARSFSTVLRLMERFPEYIFLQTQPQLYDYLKNDYPALYEDIKKRVSEGRWEAAGGMWLEADCNIPSGESLVRQLLFGVRFLQEEFGTDCTYLWLPDVFGYSWALPQILKKSGIDTFMTTKISWNDRNRMPHDTFRWRGIDGTEVLAHFITTPDPGSSRSYYTYNGKILPETVLGIWNQYRDKEINTELLLSYGYGDGGGGVNREMLEMRRRLERMPGLPDVTTGRADDYFANLARTVSETDRYVHTWDGELYLEYHRGTYTSQAHNKKMNRKLELALRENEWTGVLAAWLSGDWNGYPQKTLNEAWKIVLRNQFHDIIPGSSIREVYEDSALEYAEADRLLEDARSRVLGRLLELKDGRHFTLFNSAPWTRNELISIADESCSGEGTWTDWHGRELEAERKNGEWLVYARGLPASGAAFIRFQPHAADGEHSRTPDSGSETGPAGRTAPVFGWRERVLETPHYVLEWNECGQLTGIFDKKAEREVLARGEKGNVLQVFEDKPRRYDAWDIDSYYQEKKREITRLKTFRLRENGGFRAVVECVWEYGNSVIEQHIVVYRDSRRIDFQTKIDWHERQQLLKVAFPVHVRSTEATYDIQFGNVRRPTHWNTSWDQARFETVGHQWVDLSERGYGVSLLNDCKYGHDIKDHVIRLSLLKSAVTPDTEQDQGEHRLTYSLLPHTGDWADAGTVREAWALNRPIAVEKGVLSGAGTPLSLFSLSADHVMMDAVKKAEDGDGIILRVHEFAGARGALDVSAGNGMPPIRAWQECDLMERPVGERKTEPVIQTEIRPYEIKTWKIWPASSPDVL